MLPMTQIAKKRLLMTLVLLAGLFITLKLTYWVHWQQGKLELQSQSERQLNELVNFLDAALSRYQSIPHVLSTNPMLAEVLKAPNLQQVHALNLYLEEVQHITEASDIYLIDAFGIAIAASNWQQSFSFIGKDFSFRPYYTDAISGKLGRYYAVGTSSDKRGFYFSYPIYQEGSHGVLGAIIVKVDIADIEQQSTSIALAGQYQFLISDPQNIVFIASIPEWRLTSLIPLTPAKQEAINGAKRYAERTIGQLKIAPAYLEHAPRGDAIYQIGEGHEQAQYLDTHQWMSRALWRVHILTPLAPLYAALPGVLLLAAAIYLLLALGWLFSAERRRNLQRMQLAHSLLEQRVKERTEDLQQANERLKDTQDELIQAAKLTVIGSLSASINHELNQPLAALRSYAQNTQTLHARQMPDKAQDNLKIIIELTDRLADIVSQFKSFTRKSQGADSATDIARCIEQALTIVKPEIDKQGIQLDVVLPTKHYQVWGDKVRLQQVLVNIMSNAIVAMQQSLPRKLTIRVTAQDTFGISIQDSGPGVRESQMEKIFEPYFTTNERHGLGLGLSISQRIIESMQGQITVANAPEGGAIFRIHLPIYLLEDACHYEY
ncbi:MAG: sensor histidine kinase [Shewanella sp.]